MSFIYLKNRKCWLTSVAAVGFCIQEGHEFRLLANPIVTADLGGTPKPKAIDYGELMYAGVSWVYRQSMGVLVIGALTTGMVMGVLQVVYQGQWLLMCVMTLIVLLGVSGEAWWGKVLFLGILTWWGWSMMGPAFFLVAGVLLIFGVGGAGQSKSR